MGRNYSTVNVTVNPLLGGIRVSWPVRRLRREHNLFIAALG
jgi:hypothetical protein